MVKYEQNLAGQGNPVEPCIVTINGGSLSIHIALYSVAESLERFLPIATPVQIADPSTTPEPGQIG